MEGYYKEYAPVAEKDTTYEDLGVGKLMIKKKIKFWGWRKAQAIATVMDGKIIQLELGARDFTPCP